MNIFSKLFSKLKENKTVEKQNPKGPQGCQGFQGIGGRPVPQGPQGTPGYYSKKCHFCGINEMCNTLCECEDCNQQKPACQHCNAAKHLDAVLDELDPDKTHHTELQCNVCSRNEKINDILQ